MLMRESDYANEKSGLCSIHSLLWVALPQRKKSFYIRSRSFKVEISLFDCTNKKNCHPQNHQALNTLDRGLWIETKFAPLCMFLFLPFKLLIAPLCRPAGVGHVLLPVSIVFFGHLPFYLLIFYQPMTINVTFPTPSPLLVLTTKSPFQP